MKKKLICRPSDSKEALSLERREKRIFSRVAERRIEKSRIPDKNDGFSKTTIRL